MYYSEKLVVDRVPECHVVSVDTHILVPHCATQVYHECISTSSNYSECKDLAASHVSSILYTIQREYPYWNRSHGSDHLFVFSWDQASEVLGYNAPIRDIIRPAIHLTTFGSSNPKTIPNHDPSKDIVIPPFANYSYPLLLFPDLSPFHWFVLMPWSSLSLQLCRWMHYSIEFPFPFWLNSRHSSWVFKPRTIYAYFRGTILEDLRYSFGVRQYLKELGNTLPEKYFVKAIHAPREVYWSELADSRFCLCPEGWSPWSPRLFDCILTLTIPVIFSNTILLPYKSQIPYDSFVIWIRIQDMATVDDVLGGISDSEILRRRREMLRIRRKVMWIRGVFGDEDVGLAAGGQDAFDLLVNELKMKRQAKDEL